MKTLLCKIGAFFFSKGGANMVDIYVALIIHNRRTFASVPPSLQPAVKAELAALGLDENGKPLPVEEPEEPAGF